MTQDSMQCLTPFRAKLCVPPPRSSWISRSRLADRVDEGFARKLTLISAPAGFGETTLLADWAHTHQIPVAWFSVDKGDNDPLHFLAYVTLGLQTLEGSIGKAALPDFIAGQTIGWPKMGSTRRPWRMHSMPGIILWQPG